MMNAKVLTYNEDGKNLRPRRLIKAHVAWNEKPPVLSLEIPTKPGRYIGVLIPVAEIEADLAAARKLGRIR